MLPQAADRRNIYAGDSSAQKIPSPFSGIADSAAAADADIGLCSAVDAAAAAAAELALLSPRSKRLREIFESLAAGRDVLTQEALVKWDYVSRSIERGLVSQYQVRALCYPCHCRIPIHLRSGKVSVL